MYFQYHHLLDFPLPDLHDELLHFLHFFFYNLYSASIFPVVNVPEIVTATVLNVNLYLNQVDI